MTDIVRKDIRSYRQLPVNLYQIQAKFRDEIRPRFGVMRGREFLMKDAYSFDVDRDALMRVLPRDVRRVRAHLHAPRTASSARSTPTPARSAASRRTSSRCSPTRARTRSRTATAPTTRRTSSRPKRWRPRNVAAGAGRADAAGAHAGPSRRARTWQSCSACRSRARSSACCVHAHDRVQMLLVRGDHMGNEVKIGKVPGLDGWRWATEAEIVDGHRLPARLPRPGRHSGGHAADRRPPGRRR